MITVKEPVDHAVVVGAGLSGLATALHLFGAGRRRTRWTLEVLQVAPGLAAHKAEPVANGGGDSLAALLVLARCRPSAVG